MTNRRSMRSVSLLAAFFCFALAGALPRPALAEPLAVIAAVAGKVEVTTARGGRPLRAAFGQSLERGDKVAVGAGGSATLFFSDGNVIELGEKSTVTVGGRVSAKGVMATGVPAEVYSQVSRFVTGGSRQTGLVAMSPLRGASEQSPVITAPRQSDVLDDRPRLEWRAVPGATRYRVSVSGAAGELWSREATAPGLDYPADAGALARGADYLWEVEALGEKGALRRESAGFHVLPDAQVGAVRGHLQRIRESAGGEQSPATLFLTGSYLFGRGLYGEAADRFTALSRVTPRSPAPHEALGRVYREIGLMDLAAAEFQQALALTREP